jgi:hypothetical protein
MKRVDRVEELAFDITVAAIAVSAVLRISLDDTT